MCGSLFVSLNRVRWAREWVFISFGRGKGMFEKGIVKGWMGGVMGRVVYLLWWLGLGRGSGWKG